MARPTLAIQSVTRLSRPSYCPDLGDFVWLNFRPKEGREQDGRRCAVVLTPRAYNGKTSLCVVCPTTNQAKGYPFEVALPAGFPVSGVVLSDHVKSLDWAARGSQFICKGDPAVTREVLLKIKSLLAVP
jgi:mRNA interferase MazF